MISVHRQDQVLQLLFLGEIFFLVIDDMDYPKQVYHFQIPRTAHARDFSPERFCNWYSNFFHTARGAINQHLLLWMNVSIVT